MNTLKWAVALALVSLAVLGNYYYPEQSLLVRVFAALGLIVLSIGLALNTTHGQRFLGFVKDSHSEIKRVVWPTRPETIQMTMIVLIMVTVLGLILWGVDSILLRAIGWLTGYGA